MSSKKEEKEASEVANNMQRALELPVTAGVNLGVIKMSLKDVLSLSPGSIIEIAQEVDKPLPLTVGQKKLGAGEVITIGDNIGIRLTEVESYE